MKGLVEKGSDGIHLHIKHGGLVRESKHPQEGFSPIEVTNIRTGDVSTKYIKRYREVEANIKRIEWYDKEYQGIPYQGWKLILDADGTPCTLDLPFESAVGSRFMKLAENLDFSQPVEFSAWKTPDEKTAFSVKQGGQNVPQKYTKENPGDCPAPVQGFNKKWNFDAQKQFLHERMMNVVIPKLNALRNIEHAEKSEPEQNGDAPPTSNVLNDIKEIITRLAGSPDVQGRGKAELLKDYFDTTIWAEIEKMPEDILKTQYGKLLDIEIPF